MVARGLMFGIEYRPRHFEVYLVVSQNMGTPNFTPTNTKVLIIGTPKKVHMILGNLRYAVPFSPP